MTQQNDIKTEARATGRDLPISLKHSVEVCRFVRGKQVEKAKRMLTEVIGKEKAIPYFKYNWDLGHKAGMASGRYPVKTCKEILTIVESAEANAKFRGLNTSSLYITHIAAHKASSPMHSGRMRGRQMKRAHIDITVTEKGTKQPKKKQNKKQETQEKDTAKENQAEKTGGEKQ
jgi:large subunit ribosomal protein L22